MKRLFGWVDLAAIVIVICGCGSLIYAIGISAVFFIAKQIDKLFSDMWSDASDRIVLAGFGLSLVWLAARWKKISN